MRAHGPINNNNNNKYNNKSIHLNVKALDIWEGDVTIRSEIYYENILSLGLHDISEGLTLRRLVLRCLECKFQWVFLFYHYMCWNVVSTWDTFGSWGT